MTEHRPVARRTDPGTSWAAAHSVTDETITRTQRAILEALEGQQMTDEEIAGHIGNEYTTPSGMRTRRAELVDRGLVADSGHRRLLASGRWAVVWCLDGDQPPAPTRPKPPQTMAPPPAAPARIMCPVKDCTNEAFVVERNPLDPRFGTVHCLKHGKKPARVG